MSKKLNPLGEGFVVFFVCGIGFPIALFGMWIVTGIVYWMLQ
jgi:hypothetical protein